MKSWSNVSEEVRYLIWSAYADCGGRLHYVAFCNMMENQDKFS